MIHIYEYTHICVYEYMYICTYVNMHKCTNMNIHIQPSTAAGAPAYCATAAVDDTCIHTCIHT